MPLSAISLAARYCKFMVIE